MGRQGGKWASHVSQAHASLLRVSGGIERNRDLVRRPAWIDKDAQKLWKRVAGNVPQGTVIDEELLGVFVQSLAEYQWAVGTLAAEGRVISTTNGYKTPHPAVAIANKAVVNILKFARLYKMDTAAVVTKTGMEKFLFGPDDGSDE